MSSKTSIQAYHPIPTIATALHTENAREAIASDLCRNLDNLRSEHSGRPASKARFDWLDTLAVLTSILCLTVAILVIDPTYPYAAQLRSSRQIVALGFLLGVMNQCLQRILPYLFILSESRYGSSTLQNYEGLLRWSPFTSKLGFLWRLILLFLLAFPLALSVLYKQFTGGRAMHPPKTINTSFTPTGPPGMQGNVGYVTLFANTTAPFLFQTRDGFNDLSADFFDEPHVYGYNSILLSNTTAAVLDAPLPDHMSSIQQSLKPGSSANLSASVRATVVGYNSTVDDHRGDAEYWQSYYNISGITEVLVWGVGDGLRYGVMQYGVPAVGTVWDGSWIFVGTFDNDFMEYTFDSFTQYALRFDVRRHSCEALWQVTRSSVQLVSGDCNEDPLEPEFQYYSQGQLGLDQIFPHALAENLGSFTRLRKNSPWLMPTHTMVIASMYHTVLAAHNATIKVQQDGSFARTWKLTPDSLYNTYYKELYLSSMTLEESVPALHATIGLYLVIAIQPALTILAYCAVLMMYFVPIGRTFGLVSIMAGIDHTTLELLTGAGFSGELRRPVGLSIEVVPSPAPQSLDEKISASNNVTQAPEKILYRIGEAGVQGTARRRRIYG